MAFVIGLRNCTTSLFDCELCSLISCRQRNWPSWLESLARLAFAVGKQVTLWLRQTALVACEKGGRPDRVFSCGGNSIAFGQTGHFRLAHMHAFEKRMSEILQEWESMFTHLWRFGKAKVLSNAVLARWDCHQIQAYFLTKKLFHGLGLRARFEPAAAAPSANTTALILILIHTTSWRHTHIFPISGHA